VVGKKVSEPRADERFYLLTGLGFGQTETPVGLGELLACLIVIGRVEDRLVDCLIEGCGLVCDGLRMALTEDDGLVLGKENVASRNGRPRQRNEECWRPAELLEDLPENVAPFAMADVADLGETAGFCESE